MGWSGNSLRIHINKEHSLGGDSNVFRVRSQWDFVNIHLQTSLTKGFHNLHSHVKHMKSWQWLVCTWLQPAMLQRGMQMEGREGFSYRRSGLTNSDYAELLLCLWPLQSIQLRDQQEFFVFVFFIKCQDCFHKAEKCKKLTEKKCQKKFALYLRLVFGMCRMAPICIVSTSSNLAFRGFSPKRVHRLPPSALNGVELAPSVNVRHM